MGSLAAYLQTQLDNVKQSLDSSRAESAALRAAVAEAEKQRDEARAALRRECELNWTGSLCDRLNSFAREHGRFDAQCTDGPSGSRLAQDLHAYAGSLRASRDALAAELAEARKVIAGADKLRLMAARLSGHGGEKPPGGQRQQADWSRLHDAIRDYDAARDSGKASGGGADAR